MGGGYQQTIKNITGIYARKLKICGRIKKIIRNSGELSLFETNMNKGADVLTNQVVEPLERLKRLTNLQNLEATIRLQNLEATKLDYREVGIYPNSVIYCDIPYTGTDGYNVEEGFCHEDFYDWCNEQDELVLISEYDMPRGRFKVVWETAKRALFSQKSNKSIVERLFVPVKQIDKYEFLMSQDRHLREKKEKELTLFR